MWTALCLWIACALGFGAYAALAATRVGRATGMVFWAAGALLIHFGETDEYADAELRESVQKLLGHKPGVEIHVYEGAEHGFIHDASRPSHRADDAADAWRRVADWFRVT